MPQAASDRAFGDVKLTSATFAGILKRVAAAPTDAPRLQRATTAEGIRKMTLRKISRSTKHGSVLPKIRAGSTQKHHILRRNRRTSQGGMFFMRLETMLNPPAAPDPAGGKNNPCAPEPNGNGKRRRPAVGPLPGGFESYDMPDNERLTAMETNISHIGDQLSSIGTNISRMSDQISTMGTNMAHMDNRLSSVETNISHMDNRFSAMDDQISEVKTELRSIRWWIFGTAVAGVAVAVAVITLQAGWFQKIIDANQATTQAQIEKLDAKIDASQAVAQAQIQEFRSTTQAQIEEFRRDSDRNYELAVKALERSMQVQAPPAKIE
jgi:high-affinity Fe2+/Pb2+ permease